MLQLMVLPVGQLKTVRHLEPMALQLPVVTGQGQEAQPVFLNQEQELNSHKGQLPVLTNL